MKQNMIDINKLKYNFKEGIYTDGKTIIEAWWSYEKESICFTDSGKEHTSVYPIVWISVIKNNFLYVGEV